MTCCAQQVRWTLMATGGREEDEELRVIKRSVDSNRQPQVARPPQTESREQSEESGRQDARSLVIRIGKVRHPEQQRDHNRRRPEARRLRQRELRVTSKHTLFNDSN